MRCFYMIPKKNLKNLKKYIYMQTIFPILNNKCGPKHHVQMLHCGGWKQRAPTLLSPKNLVKK